MERVSNELRRGGNLPSSDTVLGKIGAQDPEMLWVVLRKIIKRLLKKAKASGGFDVPVDIAIDYHDMPYYGKERSCWIIRRRAKDGTKWCYRWATLSVIVRGRRFILACMPVKNTFTHEYVIRCLIHEAKKHVRCIRYVTLDREFYSIECIRCLKSLNLRYILPAKEFSKLKSEMKKNLSKGIYCFKYVLKNSKDSIEITVKVAWSKSRNKYIPYVTNTRLSPENVQEVYRRRWGIETCYREVDMDFLAKTTSNKFAIRLIYFWMAVFLFNLWTLANFMLMQCAKTTNNVKHIIAWAFCKRFLQQIIPG